MRILHGKDAWLLIRNHVGVEIRFEESSSNPVDLCDRSEVRDCNFSRRDAHHAAISLMKFVNVEYPTGSQSMVSKHYIGVSCIPGTWQF